MLQEGNHVRPLAASLLPTYSVNHSFSPYSGLGSSSSHAEFVAAGRPFFLPRVALLQRRVCRSKLSFFSLQWMGVVLLPRQIVFTFSAGRLKPTNPARRKFNFSGAYDSQACWASSSSWHESGKQACMAGSPDCLAWLHGMAAWS